MLKTTARLAHQSAVNAIAFSVLSLTITFFAGSASAADKSQIISIAEAEIYRVNFRLDARGHLAIAGSESDPLELPLVVHAKQSFLEKRLETDKPLHCVRHYASATAAMQIGKGAHTIKLNEPNPHIFQTESFDSSRSSFRIYSTTDPLSGQQIELLTTPANFLVINRLLRQATPLDATYWRPSDRDLALLLNLDTLSSNQVRLENVGSDSADRRLTRTEIILSGTVVGMAEGAETEILVKGKLQIDQATHVLSQVDLELRESRQPGPAAPGFEIEAALRMEITPLPSAPQLSDQALAKLDARQQNIKRLIFASAQNGFEISHDQRWRVMTDRPGAAMLRMIDAANLLAQCEIMELPNLPQGKLQTLDEFCGQLRKGATEQLRVIADASESAGLDGTQILRVVAAGTADKSPMNYVCYQISNLDGRRFSLMFSVDPDLSQQFDDQDLRLAETFRFTERSPLKPGASTPVAEQPSAAK